MKTVYSHTYIIFAFVASSLYAVQFSPAPDSIWSPPPGAVPAGWRTLTTIVSPAGAGKIEMWPYGGAYRDSTSVRASANPASGYAFLRWEGTGGNLNNQASDAFQMTSDRTIRAVFAPVEAPTIVKTVSSVSELTSAIASAQPGTRIECNDGTYTLSSSINISVSGTAVKPILLKAKNRGGAVITGAGWLILNSVSNVVIEGFKFIVTGQNAVDIKNSANCRVTRNYFEQGTFSGSQWWVTLSGTTGHHNRIDHNSFNGKRSMGNYVSTTTREGTDLKLSQFDVIDHNRFIDIGPSEGNGKEAIRLGNSYISMYKGYYLVEQNFFDRCDGDAEVISNKSCDNIHRWNTFINCWGSLCLRHGNRCVVDGNTFIRPDSIINWAKVDQSIPIDRRIAGVRTYGDDQVIINNYFQQVNGGTTGLGVCVLASGDVDWTEDNYPAGDLSACNSADRDFVAFNTYVDCPRSSIDFNYSSGGNIPANEMMLYNNLIAARQGRNPGYLFNLPSGISAPTNCQWKGNMGYMAGTVTIGNYPGTFTTQQLRIADPKLIRTSERYTITPESPAVGAASSDDIPYRICVPWDIEGQPRTATSDVGCDQLSTVIRRNKVLTPEDVGPEAPEDIVTSAENNERNIVPASFALCQNYPNPFNPETVIRFSSDQNAAAELVVYNLIGEEIAVLFNEQVKSGSSHQVSFNAGGLPSGIYFYRLAIGGRMAVKKMVVMR